MASTINKCLSIPSLGITVKKNRTVLLTEESKINDISIMVFNSKHQTYLEDNRVTKRDTIANIVSMTRF